MSGWLPQTGVYYDRGQRKHFVVLVLDPDEAENLADGLPLYDGAVREMYNMAAEARAKDTEDER